MQMSTRGDQLLQIEAAIYLRDAGMLQGGPSKLGNCIICRFVCVTWLMRSYRKNSIEKNSLLDKKIHLT